jgi:hypothetical protein
VDAVIDAAIRLAQRQPAHLAALALLININTLVDGTPADPGGWTWGLLGRRTRLGRSDHTRRGLKKS